MTNQATPNSNSIINAVKRLERAGSENSRATEKLIIACQTVANYLIDTVPEYVEFGGYVVAEHWESNSDLYSGTELRRDSYDGWKWNRVRPGNPEFGPTRGDWTRMQALQFAKDLAEGLINKAAAAVEAHLAETKEGAEVAEKATTTL